MRIFHVVWRIYSSNLVILPIIPLISLLKILQKTRRLCNLPTHTIVFVITKDSDFVDAFYASAPPTEAVANLHRQYP
jgi:hypothetical protein